MKRQMLAAAMSLVVAFPVYAAPASEESIHHLMEKTGSGDMGVQLMAQLLPSLKQLVPDATDDFWAEVMSQVNSDEIIDIVVPIYQRHLTQDEVDAINDFYDTPAGQTLIQKMPVIMQESMGAGQLWGRDIARRIVEQYQEEQAAQ